MTTTMEPQTIDASSVFSEVSSLPSDILYITRVANLYSSDGNSRINDLIFDPSQENRAAILDNKGSISFISVDPKKCSLLATINRTNDIPRFCLCFTKDGTKLIL